MTTAHVSRVIFPASELPVTTLPASPEASPAPLEFSTVFRQEFPFVWRNVRRLGVASSEVDDAVQKVFLVVHRRIGELRGLEPGGHVHLRSWLFQIVRRVARDERRGVRTRAVTTETRELSAGANLAPSRERPDLAYEEKVAAAQLCRILDNMEDGRREVFVLADLEGFTIPQIAEATGVNTNTLYARLRAARQEFECAVVRVNAAEGQRRWNL